MQIGELYKYDGIIWKVISIPKPRTTFQRVIDWVKRVDHIGYTIFEDTRNPEHKLYAYPNTSTYYYFQIIAPQSNADPENDTRHQSGGDRSTTGK